MSETAGLLYTATMQIVSNHLCISASFPGERLLQSCGCHGVPLARALARQCQCRLTSAFGSGPVSARDRLRADLRQSAIHALAARATPRDTVRKAHFSSCRSPSANVGRHACMIPRTDGLAKRPAPATQHADIQTLILLKKGVGFTLACEIVEDLSGGPPVPSGRAINRAASRWPVSSSLFALPPIRDAGRHRGLRRDAMDSSNRAGTALRLVCRGLRQRRAAVA